ncbi:hypothetical protein KC339_g74 [Hortaea werneckii]|nr:hypothetical protein KC339_g74 [Hortaea werneckii]
MCSSLDFWFNLSTNFGDSEKPDHQSSRGSLKAEEERKRDDNDENCCHCYDKSSRVNKTAINRLEHDRLQPMERKRGLVATWRTCCSESGDGSGCRRTSQCYKLGLAARLDPTACLFTGPMAEFKYFLAAVLGAVNYLPSSDLFRFP